MLKRVSGSLESRYRMTDSWCEGDNKGYSRGPVAVSIFSEFPGRLTPVASEGAEWKLARKHMS